MEVERGITFCVVDYSLPHIAPTCQTDGMLIIAHCAKSYREQVYIPLPEQHCLHGFPLPKIPLLFRSKMPNPFHFCTYITVWQTQYRLVYTLNGNDNWPCEYYASNDVYCTGGNLGLNMSYENRCWICTLAILPRAAKTETQTHVGQLWLPPSIATCRGE